MQQILVYSDSLSWGIIPGTRQRFSFDKRWPGVMQHLLREQGLSARVIENCLNGRRTVLDDPFKPGRNGLEGLAQAMEINSPVALLVIALGTNDFQMMHNSNAWSAAQGVAALVDAVRKAPIEPTMSIPEILIVAPPVMQEPKGPLLRKFEGASLKAVGFTEELRQVAEQLECHFFTMERVTEASRVDGIHLDADQHQLVGKALAEVVGGMLNDPMELMLS